MFSGSSSSYVFSLLVLLFSHFASAEIPSLGCNLLSELPAGKICGKIGGSPVHGEGAFSHQTLPSVSECQDLCLRRGGSGDTSCASFSFDSSSNLCTITPAALLSVVDIANSTKVFFERGCFDCPNPCPSRAPGSGPFQNLFDNSGFETSTSYIGPWFSTGRKHKGIYAGGFRSNHSWSCTASAGATRACTISQSFNNCPNQSYYGGTVYQLSYKYKATTKGRKSFHITARYGTGNAKSFKHPVNSSAPLKWQTYSDIFQVKTDELSPSFDLTLHPGKPNKGEMHIRPKYLVDKITLKPTNYFVAPEPRAYNSLLKGGLEDGVLTPWTPIAGSEGDLNIVSPGIRKQYALNWSIPLGKPFPFFGLQQDMSQFKFRNVTEPGKPYLFNIDYRTNIPEGHGIRPLWLVKLELFTSPKGTTTPNLYNSYNMYTQYFKGAISTIRIPFQGQPNQRFIKFKITLASAPTTGNYTLMIDNISVKPLNMTEVV